MKNIDKKGRTKWVRHVRLDFPIFDSAAFRALSAGARVLLFELCGIHDGSNNGELFLSVRDAARLMGMSDTGAASRAFKQLEAHGLIAPTSQGSFSRKQAHATCWRLTFLRTRQPATREFANWRPKAGSAAEKRLRLLADCKLRSSFPALAVVECHTDAATPLAQRCESVGESGTAMMQQPQFSVPVDVVKSDTQLVNHSGGARRASIDRCNAGRAWAREWLDARGAGMQKQLARQVFISESKLSRFLKNASGRTTLTEDEIQRLIEVAKTPRPIKLRRAS